MRITHAELDERAIPLSPPFQNAHHEWRERRSLLLTLTAESGSCTVGEAAPLPGYSKDTLPEARDALRSIPTSEWNACLEQSLPRLLLERVRGHLVETPSACYAAESALLMMMAQRRAESFSDLLSAAFRSIGGHEHESDDDEPPAQSINWKDWRTQVPQARAAGLRFFKFKLGRDLEREAAELTALEEQLVEGESVRLDANGSLPAGFPHQVLAGPRVEFVEESHSASALGSPRALPYPLALDESLWRCPEEARRWLESGHLAAIVVKPMALGLLGSLEWAARAQRARTRIVVSHLFDGSVAHASYRALGKIIGSPRTAMGLGVHPALSLWNDRLHGFEYESGNQSMAPGRVT